MKGLKQTLLGFLRDEGGMETVEYAVAGTLITLGSVAAFISLGDVVDSAIRELSNAIRN